MEDYDGLDPDETGSDWDDFDWPDDWVDWADEYGWDVYDIEISVSYGEGDV